MQGTMQGLAFVASGDYGPEVTRKGGALVPWASFLDMESGESVRMTCDEDWDGAIPDVLTKVEVTVAGSIKQEAAIGEGGRAFARGAKVNLRVLSIVPA